MEANPNNYIEIAVGSVSNRAIAIPPQDLHKYIKPNTELYRSLFTLDGTAFDHFRDQHTIKTYKGKYSLDRIILDVDKGKDTGDYTMTRTQNVITQLVEMGCEEKYIRVWFSGRGFHIDIPNLYGFKEDIELPQIVKQTIDNDFGKTVDNIYDKGRLIRVGHSFNLKSQLYKIPLSVNEIFNIEYKDVKELALNQMRPDGFSHETVNGYTPIWEERIHIPKQVTVSREIPSGSKFNANITCVQKMWGADKSGRRHVVLLRMINAWRRMGITKEMSHSGAMACVPSLESAELEKVVNDVYKWEHQGYSCNDHIMSEFCDSACKYFKQKNYGTEIKTVQELSNSFREFIQTDFTESSFNLKDMYNIPNDYRFMPGELAVLIGDTKLGKTAWIQNIIAPLKSMKVLFLSLEVNEWMIFRRFAQVANGMTKAEVNEIYLSDNKEMIKSIESSLDHINITTTAPNIESVKEIVCDKQPDIVIIDTIDAIDVPFSRDPLSKMDTVINGLKAIANEQNMIFFGISHISKSASGETLNIHSAKGSSAIEQKADKVLGIIGDRENSQRRVIRSLASRDEDGFELAFMFDYSKFQFKEIT
tara:strand:+ start:6316 stop:8085 length:1770 start_codon:yes stop_codon:yes gene_type:complete